MSQDSGTSPTEGPKVEMKQSELEKFCATQIRIPPALPGILKEFTKAAIRTQPPDLVAYGATYFRSLADGEAPPVKERLEYPTTDGNSSGLTMGVLRALNKQFIGKNNVTQNDIRVKWKAICMDPEILESYFNLVKSPNDMGWTKVLVLLCGQLGGSLNDTMTNLCKVLTDKPEGAEPYVPFEQWMEAYRFIREIDEKAATPIDDIEEYLGYVSKQNNGLIGPRDFTHKDCPSIQ